MVSHDESGRMRFPKTVWNSPDLAGFFGLGGVPRRPGLLAGPAG
jgi:hypothetical protein